MSNGPDKGDDVNAAAEEIVRDATGHDLGFWRGLITFRDGLKDVQAFREGHDRPDEGDAEA